jgi:hypothetical protein
MRPDSGFLSNPAAIILRFLSYAFFIVSGEPEGRSRPRVLRESFVFSGERNCSVVLFLKALQPLSP